MGFTRYSSSDPGAPVLNGQAGSLISVLDAILVNGYGTKAPAGWSKPFSATNIGVYRPGAGTRCFLRVQDNAPHSTALGREARVVGYKSMTDVNTGTGMFGNAISGSYGIWRKSATADSTARAWKAFADNRTLYLFIRAGDSGDYYYLAGFGDFFSFAPSDPWNCCILNRDSENTGTLGSLGADNFCDISRHNSHIAGHYWADSPNENDPGATFGKSADFAVIPSATVPYMSLNGTGMLFGRNPIDNSIQLCRFYIHKSNVRRGWFRGIYQVCHTVSTFTDGYTWTSIGDFGGRSFEIVLPMKARSNGNDCMVAIETSDTLETNA